MRRVLFFSSSDNDKTHPKFNDPSSLVVKLGAHVKGTTPETNEPTQIVCEVEAIIGSKDYMIPKQLAHDLALLKLKCPKRPSSDEIRPICMAESGSDYLDETVAVMGWGRVVGTLNVFLL